MNAPHFLLAQSAAIIDILKAVEENPNNMNLGKSVRAIIKDYKEGKYNAPSEIVVDIHYPGIPTGTTLEEAMYQFLGPNGYEVSEVKKGFNALEHNPEVFLFRDITHPAHPKKAFKYRPEYEQDLNGPQGKVDMLPILKKDMEKFFGIEIIEKDW